VSYLLDFFPNWWGSTLTLVHLIPSTLNVDLALKNMSCMGFYPNQQNICARDWSNYQQAYPDFPNRGIYFFLALKGNGTYRISPPKMPQTKNIFLICHAKHALEYNIHSVEGFP